MKSVRLSADRRTAAVAASLLAALLFLALLPAVADAALVLREGQEGRPVAKVKTARCKVRKQGFFATAVSTDRAYRINVFIEGAWRGTGHRYQVKVGQDDPAIDVNGPQGPFSSEYPPPEAPLLPLGNGIVGQIGFTGGGSKLGLSASLGNSDGSEGIVFFPGTLRCT